MQQPFLLSDEQVSETLEWELCLNAARETFQQQYENKLLLTEPRVKRLMFDDVHRGYRVKGVAFTELGFAGLRASRTVLLNQWPNMKFIGLVEERTSYRWRVGAVTAVSLEALGRDVFESVCLFGAGRLADTTLQALSHRYSLGQVTVLSRTAASREEFAANFRKQGLNVQAGDNPAQAVRNSELIITMTSADEVLVKSSWVDESAVVVSMGGGQELDFALLERAGHLFVDDLKGCLESGDLSQAQEAGDYQSEWVSGTIAEFLASPDKYSAMGPVVLIPRGMAAMDVMQAYRIVQRNFG